MCTQGDISNESAETMQRRRLVATECIASLNEFKKSFANHPKRDQFTTIIDNEIQRFFMSDAVFDVPEQDIGKYMQDLCQYIVSIWSMYIVCYMDCFNSSQ